MNAQQNISERAVVETVTRYVGKDVAATDNLSDDIGLDSIDRLNLMTTVEQEHGVDLQPAGPIAPAERGSGRGKSRSRRLTRQEPGTTIEREPQEEVMTAQERIAEASIRMTVAQFIGQDLGQVSETADFSEDLGMDSLDRLELMAAVEKEYDVTLSDEELSSVSNMRELIRALAAAPAGRPQ
jgi:acyl carrier protein